ncbi:hypothetical protein HDU97_010348 [Phlyctochytrium planicorne]|nr:hypothetical protein HDU97_010348 [Phlyctochytrium planicorne]
MPVQFTIIDAFTTTIFGGNPASVIVLPPGSKYPSDTLLTKIAAEFNLSETAFLIQRDPKDHPEVAQVTHPVFSLRWFTPRVEVDLCGHATLASAFKLLTEVLKPAPDAVSFLTLSGVLTAKVVGSDERGPLICLDFPEKSVRDFDDEEALGNLERAFGFTRNEFLYVGRSDYSKEFDILVEVEPGKDIGNLDVKTSFLTIPNVRCVILTSKSHPQLHPSTDFVSRVFAPNTGVPEDPVTGSAHCTLAFHHGTSLQRYKGSAKGKTMKAKQLSERSGNVEVLWDREGKRVQIWGNAVKASEGSLFVDL